MFLQRRGFSKFFSWIIVCLFGSLFLLSCMDWEKDDKEENQTNHEKGVWVDTETNLMWTKSTTCCFNSKASRSHCDNLSFAGHDDWRLPSISELRSLIRGCSETETAGSCRVNDPCLNSGCWDDQCDGCEVVEDPVEDCYWPSTINGSCDAFWSSSTVKNYEGYVWHAIFANASIDGDDGAIELSVICVR